MSYPKIASSASRPVLIMVAVLAGANTFVSGTAFIDVVPRWVSGLAGLTVAAVTMAWGVYTQGQVVPTEAVGARQLPDGTFVAGDAAPQKTDTPVVLSPAPGAVARDL